MICIIYDLENSLIIGDHVQSASSHPFDPTPSVCSVCILFALRVLRVVREEASST